MAAPETHCEFIVTTVSDGFYAPHRTQYVCRKHGMSGFQPDSTVTELGAFTLCPIGKIEYATQLALERIADAQKLKE